MIRLGAFSGGRRQHPRGSQSGSANSAIPMAQVAYCGDARQAGSWLFAALWPSGDAPAYGARQPLVSLDAKSAVFDLSISKAASRWVSVVAGSSSMFIRKATSPV